MSRLKLYYVQVSSSVFYLLFEVLCQKMVLERGFLYPSVDYNSRPELAVSFAYGIFVGNNDKGCV